MGSGPPNNLYHGRLPPNDSDLGTALKVSNLAKFLKIGNAHTFNLKFTKDTKTVTKKIPTGKKFTNDKNATISFTPAVYIL